MVDDVRPGANLVFAMRPADVVRGGEAPVIAESGVPSLRVAEIGVARNREEGDAAAAQVRAVVGTGNPQHVRPNIRAKVRRLAVLAHACKADVAVDHKVGRKSQGVPHGHELHKRVEVTESAVTGTVSNGLAQAGLTVKHRLHGAVLGKDAVPGGAVPVHLAVKVVAIQFLSSRLEIVGVVAGTSRRRNQSQYFRRDGIYRDGGLVGKGRASGAVRVSCVRVIN